MIIFSLIFEGAEISFDPYNGIFGLFTEKWFEFYIWIGLVCGLGCYVLYVVVAKLLDALVIGVTLNFEPVGSAILVWLLGVQSLPGILTIIGSLFILPGVILVVYGQDKASKQNGNRVKNEKEIELYSYLNEI